MAINRRVNVTSFEASADLSANLHRIVQLDTNGRLALGTGTATVLLGVLLNKPTGSAQAARVAIDGSIVKCEAGAAINPNDYVTAVAGGRGSAITTENANVVGQAVSAASGSGVLFELLVNPGNV